MLLRIKMLKIYHQLIRAGKLAGGFLSVGITCLLDAIILQFVTLKYYERRMVLWQMEL